jgi:hypothetical protein
MDKTVKISCTGTEFVDFHNLTEFQGDLKDRSIEQIEKLKKSILTDGFSYPFFIWQDNGINFIIDGHGRLTALFGLEKEGWVIPLLPAAYIKADNKHDAKLKLLKCVSRFGDITEAAYSYFTDGINIEDLSEIEVQFDKVEILKLDSGKYLEEVRDMLETSFCDTPEANIIITCPHCMEDSSFSVTEIKRAIK